MNAPTTGTTASAADADGLPDLVEALAGEFLEAELEEGEEGIASEIKEAIDEDVIQQRDHAKGQKILASGGSPGIPYGPIMMSIASAYHCKHVSSLGHWGTTTTVSAEL